MSGFMKTVRISTQPSCYFSKKIHRLFQRQCVTALPTPGTAEPGGLGGLQPPPNHFGKK